MLQYVVPENLYVMTPYFCFFLYKCRSFQKVVGTATIAPARFVGGQLLRRRFRHSRLFSNVYNVEMHVKLHHPHFCLVINIISSAVLLPYIVLNAAVAESWLDSFYV
jgi:hypothetical protein